MLTQEDLNAISNIMDEKFSHMDKEWDAKLNHMDKRWDAKLDAKFAPIYKRLDHIEESLEEVRSGTNALLDWADRVEDVIGVPIIEKETAV